MTTIHLPSISHFLTLCVTHNTSQEHSLSNKCIVHGVWFQAVQGPGPEGAGPGAADVWGLPGQTAAGGLKAGAEATVAKRVARAQGAMFEAKSLVQDYRLQAIEGTEGA